MTCARIATCRGHRPAAGSPQAAGGGHAIGSALRSLKGGGPPQDSSERLETTATGRRQIHYCGHPRVPYTSGQHGRSAVRKAVLEDQARLRLRRHRLQPDLHADRRLPGHLPDRRGGPGPGPGRRRHVHRAHLGLRQRPHDRLAFRPHPHPLGPAAALPAVRGPALRAGLPPAVVAAAAAGRCGPGRLLRPGLPGVRHLLHPGGHALPGPHPGAHRRLRRAHLPDHLPHVLLDLRQPAGLHRAAADHRRLPPRERAAGAADRAAVRPGQRGSPLPGVRRARASARSTARPPRPGCASPGSPW